MVLQEMSQISKVSVQVLGTYDSGRAILGLRLGMLNGFSWLSGDIYIYDYSTYYSTITLKKTSSISISHEYLKFCCTSMLDV